MVMERGQVRPVYWPHDGTTSGMDGNGPSLASAIAAAGDEKTWVKVVLLCTSATGLPGVA